MTCCQNKALQGIFLGSAGLFAGMSTTLSLVAVPALLSSSDPVTAWRVVYKRGGAIAIASILTSGTAALVLYHRKLDDRFLPTALLNLVIIPYTLVFMKPTNDTLCAIEAKESVEAGKELITKWSGLQWVRTALSISAFALGVRIILKK